MSYVNDFQITFVVARHISDLTGNPVCIYFLALPVIFMVIRYIFYFSMQIIPSSFFQCQNHMVSLCLMDYEQFNIAILLILTIHRDLKLFHEKHVYIFRKLVFSCIDTWVSISPKIHIALSL